MDFLIKTIFDQEYINGELTTKLKPSDVFICVGIVISVIDVHS